MFQDFRTKNNLFLLVIRLSQNLKTLINFIIAAFLDFGLIRLKDFMMRYANHLVPYYHK